MKEPSIELLRHIQFKKVAKYIFFFKISDFGLRLYTKQAVLKSLGYSFIPRKASEKYLQIYGSYLDNKYSSASEPRRNYWCHLGSYFS